MPITDSDAVKTLTYKLLENGAADATGTALLTNMFSITEIIDSLNRVQQDFLLETGITLTRTTFPGVVGQGRYDLPVDSIRPYRVTWSDGT